jgi:hypothetical protein
MAAILQGYMHSGKKEAFGYGSGDERSYFALAVTPQLALVDRSAQFGSFHG